MLTFTVHDLPAKNIPANANRVAIISKGKSVTYERIGRARGNYRSVVAYRFWRKTAEIASRIHLPKSVEEVVATFAVARIGAVFVDIPIINGLPANWRSS